MGFWTTNLSKLLKLTKKNKRELNPNVLVAKKRTQIIATILTNYKIQAHEDLQLLNLQLVVFILVATEREKVEW